MIWGERYLSFLVDIGEMVEHHCLNYIMKRTPKLIDWLSDCCLTPTWAVFQLYRDVNKFCLNSNGHPFHRYQQKYINCQYHENTYSQSCIKRSPLRQRVSEWGREGGREGGSEWVSEWLTPIQPFTALLWREQVNIQWDDDDDNDEVRFVLDQHDELGFILLAHLNNWQSAGRHVAPLGHIILIPSQPVFDLSP